MDEKDIKILGRSFQFALRVMNVVEHLPNNNRTRVLGAQLLRAGTSVGANVEEAVGAYSKKDFTHMMNIALKEARETHYWLRLLQSSDIVRSDRLDAIIGESVEIKKILGAIVRTSRRKNQEAS